MPTPAPLMQPKKHSVMPEQKALFFLGNVGVFLLLAAFLDLLGTYVSNDAHEYIGLWEMVRNVPFLDAWLAGRFEIGSLFVFWAFAQVLSPVATFYFIGLGAFSIKYYLIRKYLHYPLGALCLYVAMFLHLHDANQIRAAIAACFVLYALLAPTGGRMSYLLIGGIASLFHYSGMLVFVLYGLRAPLTGLAFIVVVSVVWDFVIARSAVLSFAMSFLSRGVGEVNLTSPLFIMQVIISIACGLQWRHFSEAQKKGAYMIAAGAVFYVAFIANPIMAHRLRELSMLGIFPLLFMGNREPRPAFVFVWLGVIFVASYDLFFVLRELFQAMP